MSKKKKKEEKEEEIPDLSDAVRNLIGTEDMLLQKQKNLKHKIKSENALEHCKKRYEEELQHINGTLKVVADQIIAISNLNYSQQSINKEEIEAEFQELMHSTLKKSPKCAIIGKQFILETSTTSRAQSFTYKYFLNDRSLAIY